MPWRKRRRSNASNLPREGLVAHAIVAESGKSSVTGRCRAVNAKATTFPVLRNSILPKEANISLHKGMTIRFAETDDADIITQASTLPLFERTRLTQALQQLYKQTLSGTPWQGPPVNETLSEGPSVHEILKRLESLETREDMSAATISAAAEKMHSPSSESVEESVFDADSSRTSSISTTRTITPDRTSSPGSYGNPMLTPRLTPMNENATSPYQPSRSGLQAALAATGHFEPFTQSASWATVPPGLQEDPSIPPWTFPVWPTSGLLATSLDIFQPATRLRWTTDRSNSVLEPSFYWLLTSFQDRAYLFCTVL